MSDFEILMVVFTVLGIVVTLIIEIIKNTKKYPPRRPNLSGYFFVISNLGANRLSVVLFLSSL